MTIPEAWTGLQDKQVYVAKVGDTFLVEIPEEDSTECVLRVFTECEDAVLYMALMDSMGAVDEDEVAEVAPMTLQKVFEEIPLFAKLGRSLERNSRVDISQMGEDGWPVYVDTLWEDSTLLN